MKLNVICSNCGYQIKRYLTKSGMYFCNINCKSEWQRTQNPVNKEWLYQKYVIEKLDCTQISKIVNRNSKGVWEWLKGYGIEMRPRGSYLEKIGFKKGQESAFKGKHHSTETKELIRQKRITDGHVPYLINGIHWLKATGRKPAAWKGGVTPERQNEYSKPLWKEAVKEVWHRTNATCQRCGKKHNSGNRGTFAIHHVYPFADYKYLRGNPDNLVLLCRECHLYIHSKKNFNKEFMLKEVELPLWLIK